jgi:NADP-dependent 3-hydroxy acid dehydrogenase YdfG
MTSNSAPDKVAVVTGASSGIGAATARALAADGYRVALLARRLDRITTLAGELGNGSIAIGADVTDRDSIVAAAGRVRQELGTAGALINSAGVMLLGPFDSDRRADYRQMIEVNLLGAITTTEVFLDRSRTAAATSSTSRRSPGELPDPVTASTQLPSGASTAGPSHCGRNCCPTSA